jgi:hypothetical protein
MHEAPSLLQPRPRDWWLRIVLIPKSLNFIETLFAVSESLKFIERYLCLCKQSVFHTIVNHALRVEIPCILAHSNMITACMHRGMHPAFVIRRSAGLRAWTGRSRRIDRSKRGCISFSFSKIFYWMSVHLLDSKYQRYTCTEVLLIKLRYIFTWTNVNTYDIYLERFRI